MDNNFGYFKKLLKSDSLECVAEILTNFYGDSSPLTLYGFASCA